MWFPIDEPMSWRGCLEALRLNNVKIPRSLGVDRDVGVIVKSTEWKRIVCNESQWNHTMKKLLLLGERNPVIQVYMRRQGV